MEFVVGQRVISLLGRYREWKVSRQGAISLLGRCRGWKVSGQGGDKSQIDATSLEHQDGTKVLFCFLRS